MATQSNDGSCSAADIAEAYGISAPLMAKVLQKLARVGWWRRGTGPAADTRWARRGTITALETINAIEGRCLLLRA